MKISSAWARPVCGGISLALLCAVATVAPAQDAENAPPKASVCQSCHGVAGNSTSRDVPRLNGQQAAYMVAQFQNFHDPGREDPHATAAMWDVVRNIDAQTLAALADYYSRQPPAAPQATGPMAEAGKKLFRNGDATDGIAACQTCHGLHAEGHGTTPRLAGQHGDYLRNQLARLRLGMRASGMMHPNTNGMSDKQIEELIAYLAND